MNHLDSLTQTRWLKRTISSHIRLQYGLKCVLLYTSSTKEQYLADFRKLQQKVQKCKVGKTFYCFWKKCIMLTKAAFIWSKYYNIGYNICKYYNLNSILIYSNLKYNLFLWFFSLQCHMILHTFYNMLFWWSRLLCFNAFLLFFIIIMLKSVVMPSFCSGFCD